MHQYSADVLSLQMRGVGSDHPLRVRISQDAGKLTGDIIINRRGVNADLEVVHTHSMVGSFFSLVCLRVTKRKRIWDELT